jgi:hypothetical protein
MKTKLFITLLLLQTSLCFAYRHRGGSATEEIKNAISTEFNKWLIKSDFETNAEYEIRIKSKSDEKIKIITDSVVRIIKKEYLKSRNWYLGDYDADNEFFLTGSRGGLDSDRKRLPIGGDSIFLKIPRSIAKTFFDSFQYNSSVVFQPTDANIQKDEWKVTNGYFLFFNFYYHSNLLIEHKSNSIICSYNDPNSSRVTLQAKNIKQFTGNQREDCVYYINWDISDMPNYNPTSIKPISFTLEDLNITLPAINTGIASIPKLQVPDLDMNAIKTNNSNPNAFAVVIGNKDYQFTKKVSYALNDAEVIKKYLINVLGYSEGNIFYIENATKSTFETYFGNKENPEGKLFNNIKQGISDVFVYYSGHGAPGLKDNKGYFVPVDCDPQYVQQGGYSLDLFYSNISKLNAKSVTIITDACFSGTDIFKDISPIAITISNPIAVADNCVVLSSSTGSQVSSWYNDKQHGMFTYFFLKAMQDKEKSDKNKDGKLSFEEIYEYVSDKTEGVPYYSRSINGVDQTPTIQGNGKDNTFIEFK